MSSAEYLRRKVAMYGEESLDQRERHRLRAAEDEERDHAARAQREQQEQEQRAVVATNNTELAVLRADHDTLRKAYTETIEFLQRLELEKGFEVIEKIMEWQSSDWDRLQRHGAEIKRLVDAVATTEVGQELLVKKFDAEVGRLTEAREELTTLIAAVTEHDRRRAEEVRQLRAEQAEARVENAKTQVEALNRAFDALTTASQLYANKMTEAAAQRAEITELEKSYHDKLSTVELQVDALATELKAAQQAASKPFKFAREKAQDDYEDLDMPQGFLPPPGKVN